MKTPCIECGELGDATRCPSCAREHKRRVNRANPRGSRARGYDSAWDRLSRRARRLQPFCSMCGSREDLQCDHSPTAWARREQGLAIRLVDVDVLCGRCNRAAGAARGSRVSREGGGVPPAGVRPEPTA